MVVHDALGCIWKETNVTQTSDQMVVVAHISCFPLYPTVRTHMPLIVFLE